MNEAIVSTQDNPIKLESIHFKDKVLQKNIVFWYRENKSPWLWRTLWEKNKNPYHIWVSEVMLQQTVIKAVVPVFERFLMKYPTLRSLASTSTDNLKRTVQGLGYYRRFDFLHRGAKQLCETGAKVQWPKSFEEWKKVLGVGDYTASALMSIAFGKPYPVVDGNVERIFARLFDRREPLSDSGLKKHIKKISYHLIDQKNPSDYNQGLMELGQKICRPRTPLCPQCPIQSHCLALKNASTHLSPGEKVKVPKILTNMELFILESEGQYALVRRPKESRFLKNIVGFYSQAPLESKVNRPFRSFNLTPKSLLGSFSHLITKYKIQVKVNLVQIDKKSLDQQSCQWINQNQVVSQLTASLDLKAWNLFIKKTKKTTTTTV